MLATKHRWKGNALKLKRAPPTLSAEACYRKMSLPQMDNHHDDMAMQNISMSEA